MWILRLRAKKNSPHALALALERDLARLMQEHLLTARERLARQGPRSGWALAALSRVDAARMALRDASTLGDDACVIRFGDIRERLVADATDGSASAADRFLLAQALLLFESAAKSGGHVNPAPATPDMTVRISSVMLRAVCSQLMPPERMAVIAGGVSEGSTRASGVFDVTAVETASVAHVRADRRKLNEALMSMEATGTRLVVWMHSHPGTGVSATHPSQTDLRQYDEWVADFPFLLAGIVTQDRWIRWFGSVVEHRIVPLQVDGRGVERVEDHVYRLV